MLVVGLVLSLATGLLLGLLGGGGSLLTLPVLRYVFGINTHGAIAMSLVVVAVTSVVALSLQLRGGHVRWRTGLTFGVTSVVASFVGGRISPSVPDAILLGAFAITMLAAGVAMLLRSHRSAIACATTEVHTARALLLGSGVGLLTGVLGAGGGFIIVPALTLFCGLAVREAVATSLLVIALNSSAALAAHPLDATLPIPLVAAIAGVAATGSVAGIVLGRRVPPLHLQRAFGALVIAVGTLILLRG